MNLASDSIASIRKYKLWNDTFFTKIASYPFDFDCNLKFVLLENSIYLLPQECCESYSCCHLSNAGELIYFNKGTDLETKFVQVTYLDLLSKQLVSSKNPIIFGIVNNRSQYFYSRIESIAQQLIDEGILIQKGTINVIIRYTVTKKDDQENQNAFVSVTPVQEKDNDLTLTNIYLFDPMSILGIEIMETVRTSFPT
jgi:hypothetical protein